ncbi:MAG: Ppx/GppA family phosphatase [Alphaproteobacteria bacterium]
MLQKRTSAKKARAQRVTGERLYAALDLGTNNCRLLVVALAEDAAGRPLSDDFRVRDSFSRIVRLGEGLNKTGELSPKAMERTIQALEACQNKLAKYPSARKRFVATEACRRASNGPAFIERVRTELGMHIHIISGEEEARLAFLGCASLLRKSKPNALVFDIGGGSTELMWVEMKPDGTNRIRDWLSVGYGVMNLTDAYGGTAFSDMAYDDMTTLISEKIASFIERNNIRLAADAGTMQMLSTSGTVTTLAAITQGLPRYDRSKIDGITLPVESLRKTVSNLKDMRPSERFNHPCIGADRADFILSGCAIFDALTRPWPHMQIRVADRGVREGIILSLTEQS